MNLSKQYPTALYFAILLGLGLWVYRDYGMSWDESVQAKYGELIKSYFTSGMRDDRAKEYINLQFYGPVFELLSSALIGDDQKPAMYDLRHLLILLTGMGTVAGAWFLARTERTDNPIVVPMALVAMIPFTGHAFINSKDIPFALGVTWSCVAMVRAAGRLRFRWSDVVLIGTGMGLAWGIRPGGAPFLILIFGVSIILPRILRGRRRLSSRYWFGIIVKSTYAISLAWLLMIAPWPYAHSNPFGGPIQAMRAAADVGVTYPTLFEGRIYESTRLPRYYLFKYFMITIPPTIMAFVIVGAFIRMHRAVFGLGRVREFNLTVLAWLVLPLCAYGFTRIHVYDGLRHFLFLFPAMALCVQSTFNLIVGRTPSARRKIARYAIAGMLFVPPAIGIVRLHPYQASYYNFLAGGVRGANGQYELDPWVTSYREAANWVNDFQRTAPNGKQLRVLVAANDISLPCFKVYAAEGIEVVPLPPTMSGNSIPNDFDLYVATTRYRANTLFAESPVVHTIGRQGGIFTEIKASEKFVASIGEVGTTSGSREENRSRSGHIRAVP